MPNWNTNVVAIDAPIEDVDAFIARDDENKPRFNMHKIFPEKFKANDLCGFDGWDYDWAVKHTGSKWFPEICLYDAGCERWLGYDTAWSPNNLLLLRLSEITSWRISNIFEEP